MRTFFDHLVFSKAWGYRLARHLVFWLVCLRISSMMLYSDDLYAKLAASLAFLPLNLGFVYFVLYRLVPRYLMRFSYWSFSIRYCVLLVVCFTIDYYLGELLIFRIWNAAPYSRAVGFWRVMAAIFDPGEFTVANVMAGLAVFIKIYKFWRAEVWMRLHISQEKARTELELLKAQLQPQFLYHTLTYLHGLVSAGSDKAPQLLMRLSAILSYILYECRETEVALEREIAICREYIALERERNSGRLEVSVDVFGSFAGKRIAPLVLVPLIGSAFSNRADIKERRWIAFEFSMEEDQLLLRVILGRYPGDEVHLTSREDVQMQAYIGRLQMLYNGGHSISRKETDDTQILSLTIELAARVTANAAAIKPSVDPSLLRYAVFEY